MKKLCLLLALLCSPCWAANEIHVLAPEYTGSTLYMIVLDNAGLAWNGTTFATYTTTQGDFDVAMTEVSGTGLFRGSLPGTSGQRSVLCYLQAGGSPASSDQAVQVDSGYFDSSATTWKTPMLATGAVTTTSVATGAIDADAVADSAIDAGALASDAITSAKIAASAIGVDELPRLPASGTLATSAEVAAVVTVDAVTADRVPKQLTFFLGSEGNVARNIITLNAWSSGTRDLAIDFSELLDQSDTTINTVSTVTVVKGATTITTSSLRKHQEQKIAIFTVAAISSANAGTYVVTATITTADSNTIVVTGTLEVE